MASSRRIGGTNVNGTGTSGSVYVLLTVPDGKKLTISKDAILLVAGNQQSSVPKTGYLTGDYGAIKLDGEIIVNGKLYARGEIDGGGTVTVNSGAEVYQRFQIDDWRGGNASFAAYTGANSVYPFELYKTAGVNVKAVYKNGSQMIGQTYIYSRQETAGAVSEVHMIGSAGSLIIFDDPANADDFVTIERNGDITEATVNGRISTGDISVDISVYGISFPLTAEGVGPFGYKLNVVVDTGSTSTSIMNSRFFPAAPSRLNPTLPLTPAAGSTFTLLTSTVLHTITRAGRVPVTQ